MAYIQSQFSFWRPLPNLVKFELDVVCKVVLIFKCILRLTKTSRHRKILLWNASGKYCITSGVQHGLDSKSIFFSASTSKSLQIELDVVCKFVLIYKCVLRLRNKSKHRKKGMRAYLNLYVATYSRGNWASYCFILTLLH